MGRGAVDWGMGVSGSEGAAAVAVAGGGRGRRGAALGVIRMDQPRPPAQRGRKLAEVYGSGAAGSSDSVPQSHSRQGLTAADGGGQGGCPRGADILCVPFVTTPGMGSMDMRDRVNAALKQAMKDKAVDRLSTLRLINAAIKDRDIAARGDGDSEGVGDAEVLAILGKMSKQRMESVRAYEEGGRVDLAERERAEIAVIEEFLPRQLTAAEIEAAVSEAIATTGASSIRDMGKVMGELKAKYTGQMDFGTVGPMIKTRLS